MSVVGRADHDVAHQAVVVGIAPGMVVAKLDHEVALAERYFLVVKDQRAAAGGDKAVVDRAGLVHDRAPGLAAALVATPGSRIELLFMQRDRMRVLGRIVTRRDAERAHEPQKRAPLRRIVGEWRPAVVTVAGERHRHLVEAPEFDHAPARARRVGPCVRRGAVVEHAGLPLCIMAGDDSAHRFELVGHQNSISYLIVSSTIATTSGVVAISRATAACVSSPEVASTSSRARSTSAM